jgi:hypothetical protein
MWTIGFADRLRFPRFPSKHAKAGKCSPSPTATTASKGLDIDEIEGRSIAPAIALTAIGADTEIRRATP